MKITRAVITAAAPSQRNLPLQTLVDRDGVPKTVLRILVEEARSAGAEEICVVVCAGDEDPYKAAAGDQASLLRFVEQDQPRGYGHAIYCARDFVDDAPFLHMVGDHIYVSAYAADGSDRGTKSPGGCAHQLVTAAGIHACSVSAVQSTRENLLPLFGAVGGQRVRGAHDLYTIDRVIEKPTPTEAEQSLMVPGLRSGNYLCFLGAHVLSPVVMDLLGSALRNTHGHVELSPILNDLAARERYLALEAKGRRYPVDVRYGLLTAQIALALSGRDRDEVLTLLCDLLAHRQMDGF